MNASRRLIVSFAAGVIAFTIALPFAVAQPAAKTALPAVSNDGGGVKVVVKPLSTAAGADWQFEVVMDTHTKPLDDDLTKTVALVDDDGRQYTPTSWEGDKPGGHHRKGVLRFPAPGATIKSFELQIEGLGGVSKRVLKWTMK
jgi:hypothetical protein